MAFHAPAVSVSCHEFRYRVMDTQLTAMQHALSATAEMWPTMSTVLRSPWQRIGRKPAVSGARQVHTGPVSPRAQVRLPPSCLQYHTDTRIVIVSSRRPYTLRFRHCFRAPKCARSMQSLCQDDTVRFAHGTSILVYISHRPPLAVPPVLEARNGGIELGTTALAFRWTVTQPTRSSRGVC
jgi:hypothetical protein